MYCSKYLPDIIKEQKAYKDGKLQKVCCLIQALFAYDHSCVYLRSIGDNVDIILFYKQKLIPVSLLCSSAFAFSKQTPFMGMFTPSQALEDAYLAIDGRITTEEVIKELVQIAGRPQEEAANEKVADEDDGEWVL